MNSLSISASEQVTGRDLPEPRLGGCIKPTAMQLPALSRRLLAAYASARPETGLLAGCPVQNPRVTPSSSRGRGSAARPGPRSYDFSNTTFRQQPNPALYGGKGPGTARTLRPVQTQGGVMHDTRADDNVNALIEIMIFVFGIAVGMILSWLFA